MHGAAHLLRWFWAPGHMLAAGIINLWHLLIRAIAGRQTRQNSVEGNQMSCGSNAGQTSQELISVEFQAPCGLSALSRAHFSQEIADPESISHTSHTQLPRCPSFGHSTRQSSSIQETYTSESKYTHCRGEENIFPCSFQNQLTSIDFRGGVYFLVWYLYGKCLFYECGRWPTAANTCKILLFTNLDTVFCLLCARINFFPSIQRQGLIFHLAHHTTLRSVWLCLYEV